MLRQTLRCSVLALAALLFVTGPLAARTKKAPTTPGTYTDWKNEIDRVEIFATFRLADYDLLIVEPLDGSHTELPESDDNTYVPVKNVLEHATGPYVGGLGYRLGERIEIVEASREAADSGRQLILRGKIEKMDPGSQAARYWAGFGAGAAKTRISGELFDPESGKVLLKFDQERRSAVGDFGGDYEELMDRNLDQIGGDVAYLLEAF